MKSPKGILLFFFLLLVIFSTTSCEKESEDSRLPAATQEGKGTFGCLVNGKVWLPTTDDFLFITMNSWYEIPKKSILINANIYTKTSQSITLEIKNFSEIPGEYKLQDPDDPLSTDSAYASFQINRPKPEKKFFTNNLNSGKLIITKVDSIEQIASGRFEFEATDDHTGEIIKITEDRFDVGISGSNKENK